MTLLFLYLTIALVVSFFCSIMEAVLLSSTHSYVESLSKERNSKGISLFRELKSNIERPIAAILIVNTFANTMGAAGVGAQAMVVFGEEWQALSAFTLTLMILYFSEIIPKTIGATHWKRLLGPAGYLISFYIKLTYPLILFSSFITQAISKGKPQYAHSRDEIMALVELSEKEGSILSQESTLIENLLKLKEYRAKDVMTPRSVVFGFPCNVTVEKAVDEDRMYIHSRIPVYKDSLDTILGLVFSQTILEQSVEEHDQLTMEQIAVPVFHVSENIPVSKLLDLFIKRKEHLFIVHDSYGQTVGIVTLEDAIETLLGVEIVDEMDQVTDMQKFARERSRIFHARIKQNIEEAKEHARNG